MKATWQMVFLAAGVLVIALAILDMLNIPLEIPTSSNTTNLVIGAALVATPFVWRKVGA